MPSPFILATLIYALRENQVLMMYRHKEPNLNKWIAPGGKIDPNESPRDCAIRELREETGLIALDPELRAVVTEISPRPDWQWLMFIYRTEVEPGDVNGDDREGRFAWIERDAVCRLTIPEADAIFYPLIVNPDGPPLEMKFYYDDELKLSRWEKRAI